MSKKTVPPDFMEHFLSGKPTSPPNVDSDSGAAPERHQSATGPVSKRLPKKPIPVRLDQEDHEALERESARTGVSIAGIIRSLVREHIRGLR